MKLQNRTQAHESGVKKPNRARPRTPIREQQRLDPSEREAIIAREAVSFFAEHGFEGQTRELARRLRITQPLLYRYFPSKEALIERVYQEVFVERWKPSWEKIITDRSVPLKTRLIQFYREYAEVILTYEWIRLFMFAGLKDLGLNARYLRMLRERAFEKVIEEIRLEYGRPSTRELPITVLEIEMVWGLHAAIFYLGVRQFIYSMPLETDVNSIIDAKVATFLGGVRSVLPAKEKG
ncbi:TetR/AcrR family transcriptional regulator [Bradyrhizobium sp. Arg237L]|uniref:TetR/AcrR family transcriptional regulator n=1 Tax=Bradyrhizobium sp. Arg237L TaxID=3003352 RepID=UPI00249ECB7B|nr:TetR/AcrR family transcriptional regulator [Bradyrhizobium sp. Arg237L]MDI4238622.1 TetR/AcrR family transcriptional regulator [Bradyrhizobium sp. Arg237L]